MKKVPRTGWAIGERCTASTRAEETSDPCPAAALYDKLEQEIVPCFYRQGDRFIEIMRHAIALNGAFFYTHRMIRQYVHEAYRLTTLGAADWSLVSRTIERRSGDITVQENR